MDWVVVTGGVYSGVGKGVVAASLGVLLRSSERTVKHVKWDGYLNHNSGTLRPGEHGECFVTEDGCEVDLDIGHYERFGSDPVSGCQSITRGKLNAHMAQLETKGHVYEGTTVQEIPQARNLLRRMIETATENADIVIFEIGGTVGDEESRIALSMVSNLIATNHRVTCIHVAPLSYDLVHHQPKTRPIQHSLRVLESHGISPHALVVRTKLVGDLSVDSWNKISDGGVQNIIELPNTSFLYSVPMSLFPLASLLQKRHDLRPIALPREWKENIHHRVHYTRVKVAISGKYDGVPDSYLSIREALKHAAFFLECEVDITTDVSHTDGLIVPGGYGERGVDRMLENIRFARQSSKPFLGICFGLQLAVLEYARNVAHRPMADSTELDPNTSYPLIDSLEDQKASDNRSGTQRLGAHIIQWNAETKLPTKNRSERFRHRRKVNRALLEEEPNMNNFRVVATTLDNNVAAMELQGHPFFVGTQFHPEWKSSFLKPHPLFVAFLESCLRILKQ